MLWQLQLQGLPARKKEAPSLDLKRLHVCLKLTSSSNLCYLNLAMIGSRVCMSSSVSLFPRRLTK